MSPARVLVVEDDVGLRETLAEVLADEGHEVRVARDGEAGLEALQEWMPKIVVLDLMMPHMDGYAFRTRQRHLSEAPAAKLLVLSAARDVQSAAAELDADGWLVKPFALNDVLSAIRGLLRDPS